MDADENNVPTYITEPSASTSSAYVDDVPRYFSTFEDSTARTFCNISETSSDSDESSSDSSDDDDDESTTSSDSTDTDDESNRNNIFIKLNGLISKFKDDYPSGTDLIEKMKLKSFICVTHKERSSASESSCYDGDPVVEEIRNLAKEQEFDDSVSEESVEETDDDSNISVIRHRKTTFERVLADAIVHQSPIEELKIILEAGSKLINPLTSKPNPIHYCVWQRNLEAAQLLIQKGEYLQTNKVCVIYDCDNSKCDQ